MNVKPCKRQLLPALFPLFYNPTESNQTMDSIAIPRTSGKVVVDIRIKRKN
jgi:hypothetical protein